jgi:hypothetical protein
MAVAESGEVGWEPKIVFLWSGGGEITEALRSRLLANAHGFQEG